MAAWNCCPPLGYSLAHPDSALPLAVSHPTFPGNSSRLELPASAAMHINDVAIESHLLCEALLCSTIRIANWGHSAKLKTFTQLKEQQFGFYSSR